MAPRGDGEDDGFLSRWSRRKREVLAETSASKAGAGSATGPLPPASAMSDVSDMPNALLKSETSDFSGEGLGMGGRAAEASTPTLGNNGLDPPPHPGPPHRKRGEGDEAPEPEMIEPPSLDLIDKDFDVAHWLKQNVPESWKLAALRRAWESDPFIAGFENPARDYALEWNIPGGAPGYGPLTESDDVASLVRGIFGETPRPEPADPLVAEADGDSMSHPAPACDESRSIDAAPQQEPSPVTEAANLRLTERESDRSKEDQNDMNPPQRIYAATQNSAASDPPTVRLRKRGGGAMPI